jgi:hypothetical protein
MDTIVGIVLVVLILSVIFFVVSRRFTSVDGTIETPIVKGGFRGSNTVTTASSSKVTVSKLESGRDIDIGDITPSSGGPAVNSEVQVSDLKAERDIKIDSISGTKNPSSRK